MLSGFVKNLSKKLVLGLAMAAVLSLQIHAHEAHEVHEDVDHDVQHECVVCQTPSVPAPVSVQFDKPEFAEFSVQLKNFDLFFTKKISLSISSRAPPPSSLTNHLK